ncbi:type I restriction endonuclease subunit R [Desulfoluna spongiiphila]|uniref:Type I restriction enzyme, R subunit n=1 Tax=Desulfoluna spongiiphila TaxID=419481 RepID=A0A1G5HR26_9BACT|nr:DEAD/DEAH box helicase family protein [Desulfoluna spongiiphila]SCY65740.1 type I restriction enzyme, R subunit [Desulfoluna spongiiphila]
MSYYGGDKAREFVFQNEMISQMIDHGWVLGKAEGYNRELALYEEDLLGFVKETQGKQWEKYEKLYPNDPEGVFARRVAAQLNKADPNAAHKEMRTFGTLGALRHEIRDRGTRFRLCQFRPEHGLNPETLKRYEQNRFRVVPELVYSPWATDAHLAETGVKAKAWRIDVVLFVNGLPVATMELKSEFKQAVENAIRQYKATRLPVDPATRKPEPLLTFKRGALVHFAVSQYDVFMTTRLAGDETFFLPFNKGTKEGGAGNDVPEDVNRYATEYLWNEVLLPDNLLNILARFVHLQIEEKEDWEGRKTKKETMIFPRYHQWDVVNKLISAAKSEGPGHKYLIQHSAGSGKSNSIAWTAHQLSSLYDEAGNKQFDSVIIVTDRTVLDAQLQDTIYQFEHVDGVVGRINNKEGNGSKSEKLAAALTNSQPIIIVTIQTFPFVLKAIENDVSLKERHYAVIADEAHSSQTGATARQLKEVLMIDAEADDDGALSSDDILDAVVASRRASSNLSYFAYTATPKTKTLELFGRLPNPSEPSSKTNMPVAYHVYSMRQAIEEGFILDVLKNYTNYKVAYNLALAIESSDQEVESKKARVKLGQWVRLHDYNIAQKVQVIAEHFKNNVMGLLGGQAKAMVVTSSRKEAVRYKLGFDKYIAEKGYKNIRAMVAFSSEVEFNENDPSVDGLLGEKFTEMNMNPNLKGRDMRKAFDSDDYQVMIVANKFQTGFDQPKLCAMYVDKKLGGVECVQTLSRMNRTYPGKADSGTFVLDFFNEPEVILESFQAYYETAELADVSNPDLIFDLFDKLREAGIFLWHEVEQFCEAFLQKSKSSAAIANICKPAVERWKHRYTSAVGAYKNAKEMFDRTKKTKDPVLIANAETSFKECKKEKDALEIFKKDLSTFVRFYEFMSQIVDYDDKDLEKLSLYARNLRPMLRETLLDDDQIDLNSVMLTHYRLSEIRRQDLKLREDCTEFKLEPGEGLGTAKAKDIKEEFISQIITRLNELFITDELTTNDMVSYAYTIRDKVRENELVMMQIANNTPEQAMLGGFPKAIDDAVMDSGEAHKNQMMQLLSDPARAAGFARVVFDLLNMGGVPSAVR